MVVRLPATANAATRLLRFAIRNTAAPDSITRGDTAHPPRVIVTLTFASVRVPDAVVAAPTNSEAKKNMTSATARVNSIPGDLLMTPWRLKANRFHMSNPAGLIGKRDETKFITADDELAVAKQHEITRFLYSLQNSNG